MVMMIDLHLLFCSAGQRWQHSENQTNARAVQEKVTAHKPGLFMVRSGMITRQHMRSVTENGEDGEKVNQLGEV